MLTFSCWETRPTDPSFLSKCRSVCHFFIPACPSQVWAMLEMSLITNWGASLLIKLSDSLLTSASRQCQLLLHTKANNNDTALYLFLRSEVNQGHGSKGRNTYDMIWYNTIPYLRGHQNWQVAGLWRTAFAKVNLPDFGAAHQEDSILILETTASQSSWMPGDIF